VPESDLNAAYSVIDEIQKTIDYLYNRAEEFAESGDLLKEFKIYEHLEKLNPNDAVIYFNKGVILFELNKYEEAAAQFIESTVKGEAENNWEVIEDSETYLKQLIEKLPGNTDILHTLAELAMEQEKFTEAESYFLKVLFLNPEDKIAHLNLGHLYHHQNHKNGEALKHFKKYLELNPDGEDREEIESIIIDLQ
jgi:tetratricopeptide (TPR) repeat protein